MQMKCQLDRVSASVSAVGKVLSAVAVLALHFTPPAPVAAQEVRAPSLSISPDCFEMKAADSDKPVIVLKGGIYYLTKSDDGIFLQFERSCLVAEQAAKPASEDDRVTKGMLDDLLKQVVADLKLQGADPDKVDGAGGKVGNVIDNTAEDDPAPDATLSGVASSQASNDDNADAALMGLLTVGCMAYTGGAACAILPALFGGMFGKDVSTKEIRGAAEIAKKITRGEPLSDDDLAFLKKHGAPDYAISGMRALRTGKYKEFIEDVAKESGALNGGELDALRRLAEIAQGGRITCDDIFQVINKPIAVDQKTRKGLDAVVLYAERDVSVRASKELKTCLDKALSG